MNRYKGSIRSATAAPTSSSAAVGKWTQTEQMQGKQASAWPGYTLPTTSTVDYLVVAGGGGGSRGGGGAGGYRTATGFAVTAATNITVTVGAGGASGAIDTVRAGNDSVFSTITSVKGGGSPLGSAGATDGAGGSGGGASAFGGTVQPGGNGTSGQGNAGGSNAPTTAISQTPFPSGGGGGAGAVGQTGVSVSQSGAGGAGSSSSITGTATTYAGGGGGACFGSSGNAGAGGSGGGGAGTQSTSVSGTSGTANTGGGGGGATSGGTTGAGGSGIVILAYPNTYADLTSVGAGLTCNGSAGNVVSDTASRSGYKVYKFTAGTGNIVF